MIFSSKKLGPHFLGRESQINTSNHSQSRLNPNKQKKTQIHTKTWHHNQPQNSIAFLLLQECHVRTQSDFKNKTHTLVTNDLLNPHDTNHTLTHTPIACLWLYLAWFYLFLMYNFLNDAVTFKRIILGWVRLWVPRKSEWWSWYSSY